MKDFIQKESQSDIKVPTVTLTKMADAYSEEVMQKAMAEGTFEDLYNKAWDKIKYIMPENMKVIWYLEKSCNVCYNNSVSS